ncbi:TlpA family protein disulfide reductase [Pedobacter sp. N23S346]|uniref:TlpA family protein disulfide reductase n=1 Tax=Pedobacter sp. N23S346 TaxID=3402750 RepID=UPI003AC79E53
MSERLNELNSIRYHYTREFSYPAENYHSKSESDMYINFNHDHDLVGFIYQYKDATSFSIFNNSEIFYGNAQEKTIKMQNQVTKASFEGQSALYNSIITLKNILPLVISDNSIKKAVADTVINRKEFYLLEFETQNKFPNYLGSGFSTTTEAITFYQKIIVDKLTLLPSAFIQTKKGSEDLNRTDFSNIQIRPALPKENSWFYSSYLGNYKPEAKQLINRISVGKIAPDLSLTNLSGTVCNLSQYNGQLILLEFWIKNCGYCISAVPKLNALIEKYKPGNLKVLAINTEDSEQSIRLFTKNNPVLYDILRSNGADVIKNYGITAFPQMVLIDKAGMVIYSGDLDVPKIDALIDKNVKH